VTQQNAALVEEATASTLAFEQQAEALLEATSQFKFTRGAAPVAVAAAPRIAARPVRTAVPSRPMVALPKSDDEWEEF
jgi:methyl-accepting chemotaxis protein